MAGLLIERDEGRWTRQNGEMVRMKSPTTHIHTHHSSHTVESSFTVLMGPQLPVQGGDDDEEHWA